MQHSSSSFPVFVPIAPLAFPYLVLFVVCLPSFLASPHLPWWFNPLCTTSTFTINRPVHVVFVGSWGRLILRDFSSLISECCCLAVWVFSQYSLVCYLHVHSLKPLISSFRRPVHRRKENRWVLLKLMSTENWIQSWKRLCLQWFCSVFSWTGRSWWWQGKMGHCVVMVLNSQQH